MEVEDYYPRGYETAMQILSHLRARAQSRVWVLRFLQAVVHYFPF